MSKHFGYTTTQQKIYFEKNREGDKFTKIVTTKYRPTCSA